MRTVKEDAEEKQLTIQVLTEELKALQIELVRRFFFWYRNRKIEYSLKFSGDFSVRCSIAFCVCFSFVVKAISDAASEEKLEKLRSENAELLDRYRHSHCHCD